MRKIKLIWDFRGLSALQIAKHHETHLKDYILSELLGEKITGYNSLSELHAIAYMVVDESEMKPIRDVLKPHRGQIYTES